MQLTLVHQLQGELLNQADVKELSFMQSVVCWRRTHFIWRCSPTYGGILGSRTLPFSMWGSDKELFITFYSTNWYWYFNKQPSDLFITEAAFITVNEILCWSQVWPSGSNKWMFFFLLLFLAVLNSRNCIFSSCRGKNSLLHSMKIFSSNSW